MDLYVIKLDEVIWGSLLVAITMAIHGTGMTSILRLVDAIKERFGPVESFVGGLGLIVLASLLVVVTNIIEVMVWTVFFFLKGAQTNHHRAFYNAMLNYTTLQAGYLPERWQLLEALLGMAGLLTFAWSTGILYMLAQDFQNNQMRIRKQRREREGKTNLNPQEDASASNDKA
jgi:hypothetical protein